MTRVSGLTANSSGLTLLIGLISTGNSRAFSGTASGFTHRFRWLHILFKAKLPY